MMYDNIPDHPDVASALRTGYPVWGQPTPIHCCECGKNLEDEEVYEDRYNEYLCLECLKRLHEKW